MDLPSLTDIAKTTDAPSAASGAAATLSLGAIVAIAAKSGLPAAVAQWFRSRAKRVETDAQVDALDAQRETTQTVALAKSLESQQELVRGLMEQSRLDRETFRDDMRRVQLRVGELGEQLERTTELNANLTAELATTRRYVAELQVKLADVQAENNSQRVQMAGMRETMVELEREISKQRAKAEHLEAALNLLPADLSARLKDEARGRIGLRDKPRSDPPPAVNAAFPRARKDLIR